VSAMRKSVVRALVLAGIVVLLTASPASADPAKPGEYTSVVQRMDPVTPGLSVKIIGGDSFLDVKADPGHEVIVFAYATQGHGEPFLRIRADGVVEENQQSEYTYRIRDRYANVDVPPNLNPNGPPEWKQVGSGHEFAWHDHRVHWMSPDRKPGIKPGDVVQTWQVDMTFDGTPVSVDGVVLLAQPISPVPWFAAAAAIAIAIVVLGRGRSTLVAAVAVLVAAAGATIGGWEEHVAVPAQAGGTALSYVVPLVALIAAAVAVAVHRKPLGVVATLLAVAALAGWAILRFSVLLEPVLPTALSFNLDRAGTVLAIGASVAAALLAVRSGALVPRLPALTDDE
jgi:hypothetical protein